MSQQEPIVLGSDDSDDDVIVTGVKSRRSRSDATDPDEIVFVASSKPKTNRKGNPSLLLSLSSAEKPDSSAESDDGTSSNVTTSQSDTDPPMSFGSAATPLSSPLGPSELPDMPEPRGLYHSSSHTYNQIQNPPLKLNKDECESFGSSLTGSLKFTLNIKKRRASAQSPGSNSQAECVFSERMSEPKRSSGQSHADASGSRVTSHMFGDFVSLSRRRCTPSAAVSKPPSDCDQGNPLPISESVNACENFQRSNSEPARSEKSGQTQSELTSLRRSHQTSNDVHLTQPLCSELSCDSDAEDAVIEAQFQVCVSSARTEYEQARMDSAHAPDLSVASCDKNSVSGAKSRSYQRFNSYAGHGDPMSFNPSSQKNFSTLNLNDISQRQSSVCEDTSRSILSPARHELNKNCGMISSATLKNNANISDSRSQTEVQISGNKSETEINGSFDLFGAFSPDVPYIDDMTDSSADSDDTSKHSNNEGQITEAAASVQEKASLGNTETADVASEGERKHHHSDPKQSSSPVPVGLQSLSDTSGDSMTGNSSSSRNQDAADDLDTEQCHDVTGRCAGAGNAGIETNSSTSIGENMKQEDEGTEGGGTGARRESDAAGTPLADCSRSSDASPSLLTRSKREQNTESDDETVSSLNRNSSGKDLLGDVFTDSDDSKCTRLSENPRDAISPDASGMKDLFGSLSPSSENENADEQSNDNEDHLNNNAAAKDCPDLTDSDSDYSESETSTLNSSSLSEKLLAEFPNDSPHLDKDLKIKLKKKHKKKKKKKKMKKRRCMSVSSGEKLRMKILPPRPVHKRQHSRGKWLYESPEFARSLRRSPQSEPDASSQLGGCSTSPQPGTSTGVPDQAKMPHRPWLQQSQSVSQLGRQQSRGKVMWEDSDSSAGEERHYISSSDSDDVVIVATEPAKKRHLASSKATADDLATRPFDSVVNPASDASIATAGRGSFSVADSNEMHRISSSPSVPSTSHVISVGGVKPESSIPFKKRKMSPLATAHAQSDVSMVTGASSSGRANALSDEFDRYVPLSGADPSTSGSSRTRDDLLNITPDLTFDENILDLSSSKAKGFSTGEDATDTSFDLVAFMEQKNCFMCGCCRMRAQLSMCLSQHFCCGDCLQQQAKDILVGKRGSKSELEQQVQFREDKDYIVDERKVLRILTFICDKAKTHALVDVRSGVPKVVQDLINGTISEYEFCERIQMYGIIQGHGFRQIFPKFKGVLPKLRCRLLNNDVTLPGFSRPPLTSVNEKMFVTCVQDKNLSPWSLHCKYPQCNSFFPLNELRKSLPELVVTMLQEKLDQSVVDAVNEDIDDLINPQSGDNGATESGSNEKKLDYPDHWWPPNEDKEYEVLALHRDCEEYAVVISMFHDTMHAPRAEVTAIKRVQNLTQWKFYQLRKEKMVRVNGSDDVEKRLFHGTSADVVPMICRDNFDWRMCGKHATAFGQGSYFAREASYSHRYTDNGGVRGGLRARALIGKASGSSMRSTVFHHIAALSSLPVGLSVSGPPPAHALLQSYFSPYSQVSAQPASNTQTNASSFTSGQQATSSGNQSSLFSQGLNHLPPSPLFAPNTSKAINLSTIAAQAPAGASNQVQPSATQPAPEISQTSRPYTRHVMFLARVLVGRYCQGMSAYKKPPAIPGDAHGRTFDSCVDNEHSPQIYVVFDLAQSYPEYIIEYKNYQ